MVTPTWKKVLTEKNIRKELPIEFVGEGWYETDTDTFLISLRFIDPMGNQVFSVEFWEGSNGIDILRKALSLKRR